MGERLVFCGSEGNYGMAGSPTAHHWYADRPVAAEPGYLRIKVMLYLAQMNEENGALSVMPGSHRTPFRQALLPFNLHHTQKDPIFFGEHGSTIPAHIIEINLGEAALLPKALYHLVYFTGPPPRRYIALKYAIWPNGYAQFVTLQC